MHILIVRRDPESNRFGVRFGVEPLYLALMSSIRLDILHPEKARVEQFLNNVDADLEQVPFGAGELSGVDDRIAWFKFSVKGQAAFIFVIFCSILFRREKDRSC